MRLRDIIGLLVALILAISVAFITRIFLEKKAPDAEKPISKSTEKQVQMTSVLVSGKIFSIGDRVKPGDLVWQEWPKNVLNPNYATLGTIKVEDLIDAISLVHLEKGEPIFIKEFVKPGEKGILAALLTPGKRAISIEVSAATASSGLISPSDSVDVILSSETNTSIGEKSQQVTKSKTLLKDIKVLAIDADLSTPQGKLNTSPHVVTLEVTPVEAEILMAAVKEGALTLSLRGLEREKEVPTPITSTLPKQKDTLTNVTVMRGKDTSVIEFKENK